MAKKRSGGKRSKRSYAKSPKRSKKRSLLSKSKKRKGKSKSRSKSKGKKGGARRSKSPLFSIL
jgi:hypothetical protein